jgi:hypothetical protein
MKEEGCLSAAEPGGDHSLCWHGVGTSMENAIVYSTVASRNARYIS